MVRTPRFNNMPRSRYVRVWRQDARATAIQVVPLGLTAIPARRAFRSASNCWARLSTGLSPLPQASFAEIQSCGGRFSLSFPSLFWLRRRPRATITTDAMPMATRFQGSLTTARYTSFKRISPVSWKPRKRCYMSASTRCCMVRLSVKPPTEVSIHAAVSPSCESDTSVMMP